MRFVPALAVLVTGLALYVSRGVLDQVLTPSGLVRVALLPPWQALGGFLALAALGLLWLDRRAVPRGSATAVRPPLGPLLLPLLGLAFCSCRTCRSSPTRCRPCRCSPDLPRGVVWLAVVTQLVWVFWQVRLVRADG